MRGKRKITLIERPDVFSYSDYREFLKDWFPFLKKRQPRFTLLRLADEIGVVSSNISMFLKGTHTFSNKVWEKLLNAIYLERPERAYLDALRTISEEESSQKRLAALEDIQKLKSYKEKKPEEAIICQYLTRWYYLAIREMSALPGFKADPEWIQKRLRKKVSIAEVRRALEFLTENGFISVEKGGKAQIANHEIIKTEGKIYDAALRQFHRDMINVCRDSLEHPEPKRHVMGETFSIRSKDYPKLLEIIEKARKEIQQFGNKNRKGLDSVYHVYLMSVPLLNSGAEGEEA